MSILDVLKLIVQFVNVTCPTDKNNQIVHSLQ